MNFTEYQHFAARTADYPRRGQNLEYPTLGLNGEAGEVAEKVKKVERDSQGIVTPEIKHAIAKELGDVLWYIAALCDELGLDMTDVALSNLEKLAKRSERGLIGGSGDNREETDPMKGIEAARGILPYDPQDEKPEVRIRQMRNSE